MEPDVRAEELGQASRAPHEGAGRGLGSEQQPWPVDCALAGSQAAWAATLMEAVARTEKGVADTLRAMAGMDESEAATRRLRLAEAAITASHQAAERGEQLRRLARWWARHAEVAALHMSVDHAARMLADLAWTEEDIATALTKLASEGGPDLAEERRRLADEALAHARGARRRARALRRLAETSAAQAEIPACDDVEPRADGPREG